MHLEVTTAHMNADNQVVGAICCYDVDSANVCIKQCVIVNSCLSHIGDHVIVTEVAECGVIYLDVPCRAIRRGFPSGMGHLLHPNSYNSLISSR